jgi:hypothetical protein
VLSKDQTLGKYQILDRLGSGGFGAVYLAMDTWVNRKVALKVPHQQQDEIVDLLKEPRIMAGLKHPNIVELITVERKNGIFFMVLEYVEGEVYANIWQTDRIVRIAPKTGQVLGWVDLRDLLSAADRVRQVSARLGHGAVGFQVGFECLDRRVVPACDGVHQAALR